MIRLLSFGYFQEFPRAAQQIRGLKDAGERSSVRTRPRHHLWSTVLPSRTCSVSLLDDFFCGGALRSAGFLFSQMGGQKICRTRYAKPPGNHRRQQSNSKSGHPSIQFCVVQMRYCRSRGYQRSLSCPVESMLGSMRIHVEGFPESN